MAVKVKVPTPLQKLTRQAEVTAQGSNIMEVIESLESDYPGIKNRLCDEDGKVRRFVNIYKNGEDIRFLSGAETPVADGDQISIIPAIAGGKTLEL